MLLGLYVGLLKYREIDPIDLHRWRQKGILVQQIKRVFEKEDGWTKGGYYPWFLQNQHLLNSSWRPPYNAEEWLILQTWMYIGGNINDTYQMHRAVYESWDSEKQHCFRFYHLLHSDSYPTPDLDSWVTFGFAASGDETDLAWAYKWLVLHKMCPFNEFTASFKAGSILTLFRRYGFEEQILRMPYLRDFFEDSGVKSVWYLKAYVYQKQEPEQIVACVGVDYGINNCSGDVAHLQLLKNTYKKVFEHPEGDPLELHKACMAGKIYEYVGSLLKIKKKKTVLRQLMQNTYPLQLKTSKAGLTNVIPLLLIFAASLVSYLVFKRTIL